MNKRKIKIKRAYSKEVKFDRWFNRLLNELELALLEGKQLKCTTINDKDVNED